MNAKGAAGGRTWCVAVVLSALVACSGDRVVEEPADPRFTDPTVKIAQTGDLVAFPALLFEQYAARDPALRDGVSDVYMGFYGGPNQRGALLSFLDTTNYYGGKASRSGFPSHRRARAIWIQGNGDWQIPAYRTANEEEHWYERASQEDPTRSTPRDQLGRTVVIYGVTYTDPYPVSYADYTTIWQNYSASYAEMSRLVHAGGNAVHARAFATGASASSTFWTECQHLWALLAQGVVASFRCAAATYPDYEDDGDWTACPLDCKPPP